MGGTMSRIETRVQTPLQRSDSQGVSNGPTANPVAGSQNARRITKSRPRNWGHNKVGSKNSEGLSELKQVLSSDVQPLRDRRREELITDITRILQTIEQIEKLEGEDETTMLCKVMLSEHARRLLLVQGTQIESDGLKGSA